MSVRLRLLRARRHDMAEVSSGHLHVYDALGLADYMEEMEE